MHFKLIDLSINTLIFGRVFAHQKAIFHFKDSLQKRVRKTTVFRTSSFIG